MYCRIHVKGKIDDNALPVLVRCDGKHRTFCIRNFFKEKSSETFKVLAKRYASLAVKSS